MQVTIYQDSTISIDGTITGYCALQSKAGTEVRRWHNNGVPPPRDLGDVVRMPKARYTLSSAAGLAAFSADFLKLWEAAPKRIGRPPLPEGTGKGARVEWRTTEGRKTKAQGLATAAGLSLSVWLDQLVDKARE